MRSLLAILLVVFLNSRLSSTLLDSCDLSNQRPDDFKCQSFDFINMTCSFREVNETIRNDLKIFYKPENKYINDKNRTIYTPNGEYVCDGWSFDKDRIVFSLIERGYKPDYEFYCFTIKRNNIIVYTQRINHYEIVAPAISDVRLTQITDSSATLAWQMPRIAYYESQPLIVHLAMFPGARTMQLEGNANDTKELLLSDLPYPNYSYRISLRLRTQSSEWSAPYQISFRTAPRAPETPPATDINSFHLNSTHVRIFWQPLPAHLENGSDFRYVIEAKALKEGIAVLQAPLKVEHATALYAWESGSTYVFSIKSSNEAGISARSNFVRVPALSTGGRSPRDIRNIYDVINQTYTLTWKPPIDVEDLADYTIFWCHARSSVSQECKEIIGFQHVRRDVSRFQMSAASDQNENPLVLAIAANYEDHYNGMHWSKCLTAKAVDALKLDPTVLRITANSIWLSWDVDNLCIAAGYKIKYCTLASRNSSICTDGTIVDIDRHKRIFKLEQLKAFTEYKIEMFIYTEMKDGPLSDPLMVKTLEGVPTPPQNLICQKITQNSSLLSWQPPAKMNGIVKHYNIVQNYDKVIKLDASHCNGSLKCEYALENLQSFTNYSIYITASTNQGTSQPSECLKFQTLIGEPSSPRNIRIIEISNKINITWELPLLQAGHLEFYEVIFTKWLENHQVIQHISRVVGSNWCSMPQIECTVGLLKYTIAVRAVNAAPRQGTYLDLQRSHVESISASVPGSAHADNAFSCATAKMPNFRHNYDNKSLYLLYESCPETTPPVICLKTESYLILYMTASAVLLIAMIVAMFLIYRKWKQMSAIECKIPAGLQVAILKAASREDTE